ncbi:P1 family peptidase [Thermococcus sp. MAR1]|uniref:DmpA family aminopeptidase n=1 Tax=Thermococcus sp. MAR1 TaxID=1638263 RepID=UPI00143ACB7A|nr:P1 family peptidase [Thermococcus sp. MAR1]NJE09547.1 S58 family peptidase [Thermococcus sp. MAR1]
MKAPELGIRIGRYEHGRRNSIADLGVKVGNSTIIEGDDIRTGVTVLVPPVGNPFRERLFAGVYTFNGFSKPIGFIQVEELGYLETPIALTSTLNGYRVADALISLWAKENPEGISVNPLVMECNDGYLNDNKKRAVKEEHVFEAFKNASLDFEEGSVGAGTGMSAFEFKGGIGSSSRIVEVGGEEYTVASLVLSNFGKREDLIIAGAPVGLELKDYPGRGLSMRGSISIVIATDAPLTSRQLARLAKRAVLGLARTGSYGHNGSGDIVLAFSTAQTVPGGKEVQSIGFLPDDALNRLFIAVADSTEEAIINSLLQARTMEGRNGRIRYALPVDRLVEIMERYGRIERA